MSALDHHNDKERSFESSPNGLNGATGATDLNAQRRAALAEIDNAKFGW